ncbi:MAG: F0F1 ATP synthase subunit I [Rhodobacteraceae bacterium]|nr:F0F1 ATP synthase subunit I [Paracoccaceae bacterium]
MGETPDDERLKRLDARIAEAKKSVAPPPAKDEQLRQADTAWRMVIELVAGLLIGFGIGYGLDAVLHTRPVMLLLFTMLGFVAGVRVMLRTARDLQKQMTGTGAALPANDDADEGE